MGWVMNATLWPLYPREGEPVPIMQEAGCTPGAVWTHAENLAPTRFDSRTVQPVATKLSPQNAM